MNRTCNQCGWVHFGVSQDYVQKWKEEWEEYCKTKPDEWLECFGIKNRVPPSVEEEYHKCFCCRGPHTNFREYKPGDCPDGCTIQGILDILDESL